MKAWTNIWSPGLLAFALAALSGCANPPSSRNVNDPQASGKSIAVQVCSNCHGMTGESISPMFPKLAGQQREYLLAQLADFKGHERSDSRSVQYMWGFTHLSAKQVDELADYFSGQTPMRAVAAGDADLARGKALFEGGLPDKGLVQCTACHGPNGEGNGSFPRLAGQHPAYVLEQIKVFQLTDLRPRGAPMKQVTHALADSDAQAIAQYIGTIGFRP
jgi:cytochrome c553